MKKEQEVPRSKRFEDYLHKVEKIVSELEEGNLPLEESLSKYEEGIKSLKVCYEILKAMEKRVEIVGKEIKLKDKLINNDGDTKISKEKPREDK